MAGTIVVDRLESDASYASSINVASPMVISNTINMNGGSFTGSVGIGTNSPNALLHINGSQTGIRVTSNTSAVVHIRGDSGANSFLYFAESGVGERGILGYAAASGDLVYRSASSNFSNGTERFRIDSSGRITNPFQPRFKARLPSGNSDVSNGSLFPFNATVFDVGSNFNTSTYRFTAPVAGYYHFNIQIYRNNSTQNNCIMDLRKNGSIVARHRTDLGTSADSGFNLSAVVYAAVNDYFDVANSTGATFPSAYDDGSGAFSYFDGVLLG